MQATSLLLPAPIGCRFVCRLHMDAAALLPDRDRGVHRIRAGEKERAHNIGLGLEQADLLSVRQGVQFDNQIPAQQFRRYIRQQKPQKVNQPRRQQIHQILSDRFGRLWHCVFPFFRHTMDPRDVSLGSFVIHCAAVSAAIRCHCCQCYRAPVQARHGSVLF